MSPNLDVLLWSLYLALDGFLAASPLISDCSALWNSEKVMEAGVLPTRNGGQKGLQAQDPTRPCSASRVLQTMVPNLDLVSVSNCSFNLP